MTNSEIGRVQEIRNCSTSHNASSYQSYTTEGSETTETPFPPQPRDLRQPGALRYTFSGTNNTTPSATSSSSSGLSISLGPSPVTPQEKWALTSFLSAPFLNDNNGAQGLAEGNGSTRENEDDSMNYEL